MASPTLETFLGPYFVLVYLAVILYGIFCAQAFYYWTTYKDGHGLKLLVFLICVLETAHVAICIHPMYTLLIVDNGSPDKLLRTVWSTAVCCILTFVGLVQSYYIWRIWHIRQSVPIVAFLISAVLTRLAFGYRSNAFTGTGETWEAIFATKHYKIYVNIAFSLNVVVDSLITIALSVFLYQTRMSAQSRNTKNIVLKLMYYSLSAGGLTLLTSVIILVTFNVSDGTITYGGCMQIIAKLYANSMLAVLNARQGIVRGASSTQGYSLELSQLHNQAPATSRPGTAIHVFREAITTSETWSCGNGQPVDEQKVSASDSMGKHEIV
ncbi:hypothetical protein BC835DRAFT_748663 [Cytidiella melzeri]|nr:hypothetical protein BC835DRAFT_748663 [Cytidiella melzeri]